MQNNNVPTKLPISGIFYIKYISGIFIYSGVFQVVTKLMVTEVTVTDVTISGV